MNPPTDKELQEALANLLCYRSTPFEISCGTLLQGLTARLLAMERGPTLSREGDAGTSKVAPDTAAAMPQQGRSPNYPAITFPPLRPGCSYHNPGGKSPSFFEVEKGGRPLVVGESPLIDGRVVESKHLAGSFWLLNKDETINQNTEYRTRSPLPDWAKPEEEYESFGSFYDESPNAKLATPPTPALPLTFELLAPHVQFAEVFRLGGNPQNVTLPSVVFVDFVTQAREALRLQGELAESKQWHGQLLGEKANIRDQLQASQREVGELRETLSSIQEIAWDVRKSINDGTCQWHTISGKMHKITTACGVIVNPVEGLRAQQSGEGKPAETAGEVVYHWEKIPADCNWARVNKNSSYPNGFNVFAYTFDPSTSRPLVTGDKSVTLFPGQYTLPPNFDAARDWKSTLQQRPTAQPEAQGGGA